MEEKNVIVKANALIEAQGKMSLMEQKMVLALVSEINPTDEDFKTYKFYAKDFKEILGLTGNSIYSDMHKIAKNIMKNIITIKEGKRRITIAFFSSMESIEGGLIEICFDAKLKPYLLQLKEKFTRYQLKNILQLQSSYSIRIYELLKQYENTKTKTREFKIEEFKQMIGCEKKYSRFNSFKQRVLDVAQKQLEEYTDICFDYEKITKGRKVIRLKFNIRLNTKNREKENELLNSEIGQEYIKQIKEKCPFMAQEKWSNDQIDKIYNIAVKKADILDVDVYMYMKMMYNHSKLRSTKNLLGYYMKALEENF